MAQKIEQVKLAQKRKVTANAIVVHPKNSEEGKKQRKAFLERWKASHDSF